MSLRITFADNAFLNEGFFQILQEKDFSADAWKVLNLVRIRTVKDLMERLPETNNEASPDAGIQTHHAIIHAELRSYLEQRGFLNATDDLQSIASAHSIIGTVNCNQKLHIVGSCALDLEIALAPSLTCHTAPEGEWQTRLKIKDTSFGQKRNLLLRSGDKAYIQNLGTPVQVEHLGFENKTACIQFRCNGMKLVAE